MQNHVPDSTVLGIFDHVSAANDAVTALVEAGFPKHDIHVSGMASEEALDALRNRPRDVIVRALTAPRIAIGAGLVAGALGGALLGLLMGLGVLVIMGTGQAMLVGPVLATLIGAVGFGAVGALAGFLFNADLPAVDPLPHVEAGAAHATLVSVVTDADNAAAARAVMAQHHAREAALWRRENGSLVPATRP